MEHNELDPELKLVFEDVTVKYATDLRNRAKTMINVVCELVRRVNLVYPIIESALVEYGTKYDGNEEIRVEIAKAISLLTAFKKLGIEELDTELNYMEKLYNDK